MYKQYITIEIKKPIYANYVGVREKYILQAKKYHKDLRIITPNGTGTVSPSKFLNGAERIEKVYLIPDQPMVLYCNHVKIDKEEPTIVEDFSIPNAMRERLREKAIEQGWMKRSGD